jgi:hypothetical protein
MMEHMKKKLKILVCFENDSDSHSAHGLRGNRLYFAADFISIGPFNAAQYTNMASFVGTDLDNHILMRIGELSSEFSDTVTDFKQFITTFQDNIGQKMSQLLEQKEFLSIARIYITSSTNAANNNVTSAQKSIPDFPNIISEMTEDLALLKQKICKNSEVLYLASIAQTEKEELLKTQPLDGDEGLYKALEDAKKSNISALASVRTLKKLEFEEFKDFVSPPGPVLRLTDALCILFDKNSSWTDAKFILNVNLAKGLESIDWRTISDAKFDKLKRNADILSVKIPGFQTNWSAVRSIANWICSSVNLTSLTKQMESNAVLNRKLE